MLTSLQWGRSSCWIPIVAIVAPSLENIPALFDHSHVFRGVINRVEVVGVESMLLLWVFVFVLDWIRRLDTKRVDRRCHEWLVEMKRESHDKCIRRVVELSGGREVMATTVILLLLVAACLPTLSLL